jgi:hypothetical protein
MFAVGSSQHRRSSQGRKRFAIFHCPTTLWIVLQFATFAHAQDSQFFFDPNGNLFMQTSATTALPQIIGQPQNRMVAPGEAGSFFVVAADTRALTYQWRFNGIPIGGSATNDALLLPNASISNEGEYRVVLTNPSGSVTSAPALLIIDSDADGVADSWELANFGSLTNSATTDFDGDGSSNLQEFLNGTNPADSNSVRFVVTIVRDGGSVIKVPDQSNYTNGEAVTLTAISSTNAPFHAWFGDIMTRSNSITLVMTNNKTLYARFTPIVFIWTNVAGGDWNVAANWRPNLAPGSNDTVIITSGITVTLNTPADCEDVTLGSAGSNPTLAGSGTLTVRGNFSWTSGNMIGNGRTVLEVGATLNVANPALVSVQTRTLENGGTILWTGAGNLALLNGAVITNRAAALLHVQSPASFTANGFDNGRIDNAGTFRKSDHAGTTATGQSTTFNNSGTVDIQTGTLDLAGGGAHSGSFNVPAGTALRLSGIHTGTANSSITGAGQFTVSGGNSTLAGLVNVSGSNTFSGGPVTFTGNYICTNNVVTISGGTANFSGTGLVSPSFVNLNGGALGGSSTVTVNNLMSWTGGSMTGSGRTIIPAGATLNVANPGTVQLNTRTLENGGTVLWTGAGNLGLSGGVITNRAGALFHVQSPASFTLNGFENGRIDNAGTFRKSAQAGTTTTGGSVSFNNAGTVDIRGGILAATGGYVSSANALLNCTLGGTTPGTGYGRLQIAGTVTLNGTLSVDLTNGFSPALNDSFTVLTAGTRNGTFANFLYPSNAVTMQLSNTPSSVIVRVTGIVDPEPMLLPPVLSSSNVLLSWTAVSNKTYRLEFNPNLSLTNWNAVPGDVIALSNTATKLEALTLSNRFYRVRVAP